MQVRRNPGYGPTLHGPTGFAIPVGVPLILAVAGYILETEDAEDECDDYEGETGSEE